MQAARPDASNRLNVLLSEAEQPWAANLPRLLEPQGVRALCATDVDQALQIIEHFNGKTVDLTPTSMIALITGDSPKIDAAVGMLSQFDIIETVRTGKVVMARGEQPT